MTRYYSIFFSKSQSQPIARSLPDYCPKKAKCPESREVEVREDGVGEVGVGEGGVDDQ